MLDKLKSIFSGSTTELQALIDENKRLREELDTMKARTAAIDSGASSKQTYAIIKEVLNYMDDVAMLLSSDGDILFANDNFLHKYGLTRDQLKGKVYNPDLDLITREMFEKRMEEARKNGNKHTYSKTLRRATDNKEFTANISIFIYNLLGKETVWYMLKDTTELTQSRNELRELNYLLNSILDNLPVYLFVKDVDNDLRYLYWNKAFAEYSKIPASRVIGHTDFEVFPDYADAQKFRDDDMEVINTGEPINRHETYEAADGKTRIVQTLKILVKREGRGPLLIGVSIDITNMQNIEHELVQERIRAEESDRLKSRFLANMSHEIRTPLNAIVGFSGLLVETEDPELRKQFSEIIDQNSAVLLQLINDILDLSKIEAGTLEYSRAPMDLLETCRNIHEVHKSKMQPGVELIFDNNAMPGRFIITEDRNRISQVINNLINNASKFTKTGEIRFGFQVKEEWIEVYVKDTGIGIAPDKVDKVFDRFVKLNPFAQGTGLGLPICKLIVETLGGNMTLESEVGKGSTFRFTIPYKSERKDKPTAASQSDTHESTPPSPDSSANPATPATPSSTPSSHQKTILVAEDVYSNFLFVKTLLKERYNLVWARDGSEAVKLYKEHLPDLILMDIKMPHMDGLEATKLIRTYSADVPIIALTANIFDSDRMKAYDAGMNDYLPKPIDRKAFEEILRKYLIKD